jgi:hypothetical protein
MARAESGAIVAMEVFVEEDEVAPVRIGLEFLRAVVDEPPSMVIAGENAVSRLAISLLTSKRFIIFPEPVGHSILKLSP